MGGTRKSTRAVIAVALTVAIATNATATDLDALKARAQTVADEISGLESKLVELADDQSAIAAEIADSDRDIAALEVRIHEADAAYEDAVARVEERAVEAYKGGAAAELTMLLSADNLADMYDISEMLSSAAAVDQQAIDDLLAARAEAEDLQNQVDADKQKLIAAQARAVRVADEIETTLAARNDIFEQLRDDVAELQERIEAREEAAAEKAAEAEEAEPSAGTPVIPPNPTWGTHDPDRLVGTGPAAGIPSMFESTGVTFEGEASWYGPGFEGNTTANGDIFDSRLYTAASRTLPFGTYLYVQYRGRGVVVYINDRGPYAGDRVLDLSHASAQAIGISGVGWVRAEILLKK